MAKTDLLPALKFQNSFTKSFLFLIKAIVVTMLLAIMIYLYFNNRIEKLDEQIYHLQTNNK